MHTEHDAEHGGLLKRIRGISWANTAIGTAELISGVMNNSSTLTMAGVHDVSDGALYALKHKAACEQDPASKQKLRRRGAIALIGVSLGIGSYELTQIATTKNHRPDNTAAVVGVIAAGANIAAVGALHSRRRHEDAHDSWKHVAGVDLPGAMTTLIITPLSIRYPELDAIGTVIHMGLATAIGTTTLHDINTIVPQPEHHE